MTSIIDFLTTTKKAGVHVGTRKVKMNVSIDPRVYSKLQQHCSKCPNETRSSIVSQLLDIALFHVDRVKKS